MITLQYKNHHFAIIQQKWIQARFINGFQIGLGRKSDEEWEIHILLKYLPINYLLVAKEEIETILYKRHK